MDVAALRSHFPVLERGAYLNAGTDGPLPSEAVEAARAEFERERDDGRFKAHFERRGELQDRLRAGYASVLGCAVEDVALTTSTSDGLGRLFAGLDLGRGDEILTSDQEHPGLLGPLRAASERGVTIRTAALSDLPDAVGPGTRLVACSHVGWVAGEVAPAALAELDVPVVLDGAQGAGAVPIDLGALGCAAYAGSGQKWLCGADGTGMLYVAPGLRERVRVVSPSYMSFEDANGALESPFRPGARRHDTPALPAAAVACSLAALSVLAAFGWPELHATSRARAELLATRLAARGLAVAPRGASTLISWTVEDGPATIERLAGAGIVVRDLPGRALVRASVGAWTTDDDLDRLFAAL